MISFSNSKFLVLGFMFAAVLLIPTMSNADGLTEDECLELASNSLWFDTVVTCENPFDVTVNMGQRLHIQNPNGVSHNMLPAANFGSPGTYQYTVTDGWASGTIRLVNPPDFGFTISSDYLSTDGNNWTLISTIENTGASLSTYAPELKLFTIFFDSNGNYITSTHDTIFNPPLSLGDTKIIEYGWLNLNYNGIASGVSYIHNLYDGSYPSTPTVYPGSTQVTQLTIDSLEVFEDGSQTRYTVVGDAPPSTDLTLTMTKPNGSDGDYNGGTSTGQPAYNHGGLISPTSSLMYGTWTFEICAPAYDMCVQESFTIIAPTEDTTPEPTPITDHTITTISESGFSQECIETGCYTPSVATVDVGGVVTMTNTDPTGVHTFTSGTVNGFTPNPYGIFDSGILLSGESFEWTPVNTVDSPIPYYCMLHTWMVGEIIVQEAAAEEHADDHGDDKMDHGDDMVHEDVAAAEAAESVTMDITSLNVVPAGVSYNQNNPLNYTRIFVDGTQSGLSPHQPLTVLITDASNGNIIYEYSQFQTSGDEVPIFGLEAPIFYINGQFQTEYNGNFEINICVPEFDVCDAESFTINSIVEDIPADTTPEPTPIADHTITTISESGFSQSCVDTGCYTPGTLTVDVGDLINMTNTDPTGVHTFTSGTVNGFTPSPSGIFDSSVLMSGDSFTWTPQTDVDQPYYCMLHTWMVGTIVVGDVDVVEPAVDNSVTTTGSNGFTIEYTDTQYRITQFENDHLYGWSLTFDGNPSSSGTNLLDQSNTNKWWDHSSDGRTGDLVKTWYYDTAKTIPLATVTWTVTPIENTYNVPTTASGTFTVTDGPNGGDCTSIGTWDSISKTCNVTADIDGGIIVGSDGITLNGNSNEFTGWNTLGDDHFNIKVDGKSNVIIKNFGQINSCGNCGLKIMNSQYVTVTNNDNVGASISGGQHITITDNVFKPALGIGGGNPCPTDFEINNNHFEQMGQNTPGILLAGAAYQDNISCVWYNLNAAGNTGSGNQNTALNFNLNSPDSFTSSSSISGRIWEDHNWNGSYDEGEGINSVRLLTLSPPSGTGMVSDHSSGGGMYEFTDLVPGTSYTVSAPDPWPHLSTPMIDPSSVSFTLSENENKIINFGHGAVCFERGDYYNGVIDQDPCPTPPSGWPDMGNVSHWSLNSTNTSSPVTPSTPTNSTSTPIADHTIATVAESGFSLDCVDTGCYTPSVTTVDVGDLINMTNTDPTGVHTFTSGTVDGFAPNPNGTFDSGVLMSGDSFTWTPQTDVDQPYYCMLHTWMVGTIVVGDVDAADNAAAELAAAEAAAAEAAAAEAAAADTNSSNTNTKPKHYT